MDCTNCGASIRRKSARNCEYCGTELDIPPLPPAPSDEDVVEHRFRRLEAHPDRRRLMRYRPSASKHKAGLIAMLVFSVLWTGGAVAISGVARRIDGGFSFFPRLFVLIGVGFFLYALKRLIRFSKAPLDAYPASVVGERVVVHSGGHNSAGNAGYYVSLEYPNGSREELSTNARTQGEVSRGDFGVAYIQAEVLLEFKRVRV